VIVAIPVVTLNPMDLYRKQDARYTI